MPKDSCKTELIEDYAHLDYAWGNDADEKLYKKLI